MEPGLRVTVAFRDAPTGQPLRGVVIEYSAPATRRLPANCSSLTVTDAKVVIGWRAFRNLAPETVEYR